MPVALTDTAYLQYSPQQHRYGTVSTEQIYSAENKHSPSDQGYEFAWYIDLGLYLCKYMYIKVNVEATAFISVDL